MDIKSVKSKKGVLWFITEIEGQTWASKSRNDIEKLLSGTAIRKVNDPTEGQWQFFDVVPSEETLIIEKDTKQIRASTSNEVEALIDQITVLLDEAKSKLQNKVVT